MSTATPFAYYSQESLWRKLPGSVRGHITDAILSLIPTEATAILDVGCGNGAVTNFIPAYHEVVACDISMAALQGVRHPRCAASIDQLPFSDHAFDLVLATDVLEHVPDNLYTRACAELARVARRWILIAVPYRELLANGHVECWQCRAIYHVHWHQRSYDAATLGAHWQGAAAPVAFRHAGERWIWSEPTLLALRRATGSCHYPFEDALCPHCGAPHKVKALDAGEAAMERYWESLHHALAEAGRIPWPAPSEILVLYDRQLHAALSPEDLCEGPPDLPTEIDPRTLTPVADFKNYGREPALLVDGHSGSTLVLPRLPSRLTFDPPDTSASLYDCLMECYLELKAPDSDGWRVLPSVAPNRYGYLLHIDAPVDKISTLRFDGRQNPLTCLIGARPAAIDLLLTRINTLLALSNELEAKRAVADAKLNNLLADNGRLQAQKNAGDLQIESLLVQIRALTELEEKFTRAKEQNEALLALSNTLEGKRATADAKVNDLLVLASDLENKRAYAEGRVETLLTTNSVLEESRAAWEAMVRTLQGKQADAEAEVTALRRRLSREGLDVAVTFPLLMWRLCRALRALVRYVGRLPPEDLD